jgi:hypothetical protein
MIHAGFVRCFGLRVCFGWHGIQAIPQSAIQASFKPADYAHACYFDRRAAAA